MSVNIFVYEVILFITTPPTYLNVHYIIIHSFVIIHSIFVFDDYCDRHLNPSKIIVFPSISRFLNNNLTAIVLELTS